MEAAPRVHLDKLVSDACVLMEDAEVPHPVADDTFARVYGRLLALIHHADRARTARPELEHLRATVLLRLEEMRAALAHCHTARCLRRWPQADDGQPDPALKKEVLRLLDDDAVDDIVDEGEGELAHAPLGRSLGALRLILLFFDTVQASTPSGRDLIPTARARLADTLAELERAWRDENDRAMFGERQDLDSDASLELLVYLALDPPSETSADPANRPN